MDERDSADPTRLGRSLWMLRATILLWLTFVVGPLFLLDASELLKTFALKELYASFLLPAVPLYLVMMFWCRERPGLAAMASCGVLLLALTALFGSIAMRDIDYAGRRPVIWAGLLAFSQFAIVLAACRAWFRAPLLEPFGGPGRYMAAFAAAFAPFVIWQFLAPMHGWAGHPPVSRNEAATIRNMRTMIAAQVTYQERSGGFYGVPECLGAPRGCIADYPINVPDLLDNELAQMTAVKNGYRLVFHAGAPAGGSAKSLQSYVYLAVPLAFGTTGVRGFCADATGRICSTPDGRLVEIENGQCSVSCQDVQ